MHIAPVFKKTIIKCASPQPIPEQCCAAAGPVLGHGGVSGEGRPFSCTCRGPWLGRGAPLPPPPRRVGPALPLLPSAARGPRWPAPPGGRGLPGHPSHREIKTEGDLHLPPGVLPFSAVKTRRARGRAVSLGGRLQGWGGTEEPDHSRWLWPRRARLPATSEGTSASLHHVLRPDIWLQTFFSLATGTTRRCLQVAFDVFLQEAKE